MGVAVSMRWLEYWSLPNGVADPDRQNGFTSDIPTEYYKGAQESISIMTSKQDMNLYEANGAFGVVCHIDATSQFWKYFQVKGQDESKLCAKASDGYECGDDAISRKPIANYSQKVYAWFTAQKNAILAKYDTLIGNHDWNEFTTNGFSAADLAGVLENDLAPPSVATPPTDAQLCSFFRTVVPERESPWPVYGYNRTGPHLHIKRHLSCGGEASLRNTPAVAI